MKKIYLWIFTALLLNGFMQNSFAASLPQIWNGEIVTDPNKYPFVVSLEHNQQKPGTVQHECGGTLVAAKWVLTAGHCVADVKTPNEMVIRYNTIDFDSNPGRVAEIEKIFIHPKFQTIQEGENETVIYDIALIELKTPINVPLVTLPFPGLPKETYAPGNYATAIGWGLYGPFDPNKPLVSPQLREASLPIMSNEDVINSPGDDGHVYRDLFDGYLMMGTQPKNNQSACNGDSGGPILIKTKTGYVEIGTVSWAGGFLKCGEQGYPDISTRLTNPVYLNWIYSTIYLNQKLVRA